MSPGTAPEWAGPADLLAATAGPTDVVDVGEAVDVVADRRRITADIGSGVASAVVSIVGVMKVEVLDDAGGGEVMATLVCPGVLSRLTTTMAAAAMTVALPPHQAIWRRRRRWAIRARMEPRLAGPISIFSAA
jgi:hypothetical protein